MVTFLFNAMAGLRKFQSWFDSRFGWFFTNGMKTRDGGRDRPVRA